MVVKPLGGLKHGQVYQLSQQKTQFFILLNHLMCNMSLISSLKYALMIGLTVLYNLHLTDLLYCMIPIFERPLNTTK